MTTALSTKRFVWIKNVSNAEMTAIVLKGRYAKKTAVSPSRNAVPTQTARNPWFAATKNVSRNALKIVIAELA